MILDRPLGGGGGWDDRLGQPKTLPVLLELPELLRSHEGKKAETRCMAAVERGRRGASRPFRIDNPSPRRREGGRGQERKRAKTARRNKERERISSGGPVVDAAASN